MNILRTVGCVVLVSAAGCSITYNENYDNPIQPFSIEQWQNSASAHKGIILLCEELNNVVAERITQQIVTLDADPAIERIRILINSNGGYTQAMRHIENALHLTTKPVDAINIGNCYSGACAILASATGKRMAYPNTHFMIHKPMPAYGGARTYDSILTFETQRYEAILKRDTRFPGDWFPLTEKERFFTPQEALQYGLIHAIVEP